MLSLCANVIPFCFVKHKDGSLRPSYILRQDIMNTNNCIVVDMPGAQYTCETELGFFVKIRSKMLFEVGRLVSLLCWLRPYSLIKFTNRSHLLLPVPSSISSSSQLNHEG